MHDDRWYYAEGEKSVGPLSFDGLVAYLRKASDPCNVKVWRAGFADWHNAKDVQQIADSIFRPPPVAANRGSASYSDTPKPAPLETKAPNKSNAQGAHRNVRGYAAFLIVFAIVLFVGAIFSTLIYENSAEGVGYLVGQFIGAAAILALLSLPWRRSPYVATVVLGIAAASVGVSNMQKLLDSVAARASKTALKGIHDPTQIDRAVEQNPSDVFLQLIATAVKVTQETAELAQRLSDDIEPPGLGGDINFASANRSKLEAIQRDLRAAESNATAALPRYVALLKDEREKLERSARSLRMDNDTVRNFLSGVDKRHSRFTNHASKMFVARAELYRASGTVVTVLIEQFGRYKVDASGQYMFSSQSAAGRYNAAARALQVAAQRVGNLENEEKRLLRSQQEGWERFVSGK